MHRRLQHFRVQNAFKLAASLVALRSAAAAAAPLYVTNWRRNEKEPLNVALENSLSFSLGVTIANLAVAVRSS